MAELYLLGGAPMSGKSTLAAKWVKSYNAVLLNTDAISREMMEALSYSEKPDLFYAAVHSAESFYALYDTPEKVIEISLKAGVAVEEETLKRIKHGLEAGDDVIVEGVAITPAFAARINGEIPVTKTVFLYDNDKEHIRKRIYKRGLWTSKPYPAEIKEKEAAYVAKFNQWFYDQAKLHGFPVKNAKALE